LTEAVRRGPRAAGSLRIDHNPAPAARIARGAFALQGVTGGTLVPLLAAGLGTPGSLGSGPGLLAGRLGRRRRLGRRGGLAPTGQVVPTDGLCRWDGRLWPGRLGGGLSLRPRRSSSLGLGLGLGLGALAVTGSRCSARPRRRWPARAWPRPRRPMRTMPSHRRRPSFRRARTSLAGSPRSLAISCTPFIHSSLESRAPTNLRSRPRGAPAFGDRNIRPGSPAVGLGRWRGRRVGLGRRGRRVGSAATWSVSCPASA